MENRDIAAVFQRIAHLLEIKGGNPFRIRSFERSGQIIETLPFQAADAIRKDPEELRAISGIGGGTIAKIKEIVETGTCREIEDLSAEVPASLLDLLKLPGVGPKKVNRLWKELGITTLDALEEAARSQKLRDLSGLGRKSEEKILQGIEIYRRSFGRFRLDAGIEVSRSLIEHLEERVEIKRIEAAGSLRRRRETVGDVDILLSCATPEQASQAFVEHPRVVEVVAQGPIKTSVKLRGGLACDLRVVEDGSFGAALQYFTGSKAHNVVLRERGKRLGLKVNEYGVFRIEDDEQIAGGEEAEVYQCLGLAHMPPELRENRGEIEAAEEELPPLVEVGQIKGDLHSHTDASDGRNTLAEMAQAAQAAGYEYFAVTDHSKALALTGGLDEEQLLAQVEEIKKLNRSSGITVLSGIEVDILADGSLDLSDEVLQQVDVVIAAVHSHFEMTRNEMTERVCRALSNPNVNILAHPTGRILLKREGYQLELEEVFRTAKEHRVCLEINAHPKRLDLNDVNCRMARDMGALISVNTDCHSTRAFSMMPYGIYTARRGWLRPDEVINTYSLEKLRKVLAKESY